MERTKTLSSEELLSSFADLPKNSSNFGRESFSSDAALMLLGLGMEKYTELLKANDVSLEMLVECSDADLISLGIVDSSDRQKILTHTRTSDSRSLDADLYAPENATEDTIIARNILKQSILMDNQLKQLLVQGSDLEDYFITNTTKCSKILKVGTEKAIQQTEKICDIIHNSRSESVIGVLLKKSGFDLPAFLKDKLLARPKLRKKRAFLMLLTGLGMCSMAAFLASAVRTA